MKVNKILEVIQKHKILYMLFAKKDGSIINSFGEKSRLKYIGVFEQYFGDEEKIITTSKFLQEKELPQSVMQGNQCCLLTTLNDSIVLGAFFLDDSNIFSRKERLRLIHNEMMNLHLSL